MACDDNTRCNGREACDGKGTCVAGVPVSCPPPLPCQEEGVCDPDTGECHYALKGAEVMCRAASHECEDDAYCTGESGECPPNPIAVGRACGGNACVTEGVCLESGLCSGNYTICIDFGRPCRVGTCDPTSGCTSTIAANSCLIDGVCYSRGATNPAPLASCQVCDPETSQTSWSYLPNNTPCTTPDMCVFDKRCVNGLCQGASQVTCPESTDLCYEWTCDPTSGVCEYLPIDGKSHSVGCLSCQRCENGICPNVSLGDCGVCADCHPETGACVPYEYGTLCGTGLGCLMPLICMGDGSCQLQQISCTSFNACQSMKCVDDVCTAETAPDGTMCRDKCHTCKDGKCVPIKCGPCEKCAPELGCQPCAECCNGVCGATECGTQGACCSPGTVCCKLIVPGGEGWRCRQPEYVCNGECFDDVKTCCPGQFHLDGRAVRCDEGDFCCPTSITGCCRNGQACGTFGCIG